MVANPTKSQFMILGTREKTKLCLKINEKYCNSTQTVILLGIEIDWKLTFNQHTTNITNTARNKTRSLARLRYKLETSQKIVLYNSYILSVFGYCPVIWMFCGKSLNEVIERVQRNALRIVYNDYTSDFKTLLNHGNHLRIHEINKRRLITEVYKCLNGLNPIFLNDLFTKKTINYNLRTSNLLNLKKTRTITYGLKSIVFRGSRIWNDLDFKLKIQQILKILKIY